MPAHAGGGHPVQVDARTGQEPCWTARRDVVRHVCVPAPVIDEGVQLPGLIRQRPRLERLLDRGTRPRGQDLDGPLPRPRGRVLRRGRGVVWAYRHPLPRVARRLSVPHSWHTGVVVPSCLTSSRPVCYAMGRYCAPARQCYACGYDTATLACARPRGTSGGPGRTGRPTGLAHWSAPLHLRQRCLRLRDSERHRHGTGYRDRLSLSRLNVKCRQNLHIRYYGAHVVTSCFLKCQKLDERQSR